MRITELFDNGQFVVTAEVGPPKGCHMEHVVEEAKEYLSGITAVNVTDNHYFLPRIIGKYKHHSRSGKASVGNCFPVLIKKGRKKKHSKSRSAEFLLSLLW